MFQQSNLITSCNTDINTTHINSTVARCLSLGTHVHHCSPHRSRLLAHPSLLPTAAVAKAAQAALADPEIATLGLYYGPDPGYQPLREELAKWLTEFYSPSPSACLESGVKNAEILLPSASRICITGGASQNLACVLQVFADPFVTRVWMVAPCYFLAFRIFEDAGLRCGAVSEGENGIDLVALEKLMTAAEKPDHQANALKTAKPWSKKYQHIIYCVPTFSNPSGKTMPLFQRRGLVQLARKHDALIITDDVYDMLQWPSSLGAPGNSLSRAIIPRVVDIDRVLEPEPSADGFGNVMSNGSFSKIAGPGVRTGWAEAMPKFVYALSQCGSSCSGGAPSQLCATIMAEMLKSKDLQHHVSKTLQPAYQKRSALLISAITQHLLPMGVKLGEVTFGRQNAFGGFFLWIELPPGINAQDVAERAKAEEDLVVAAGQLFQVPGDHSISLCNALRLCFAWEGEAELVQGVERLARTVKKFLDGDSWNDVDREKAKGGVDGIK